MRTETDTFYQKDNECFQVYGMLMPDGDIGISAHDPFDAITVSLSKRKAAKLARQILELSGETKQNLAAENKRMREALECIHEYASMIPLHLTDEKTHSNEHIMHFVKQIKSLSELGGDL
ncbi:TPA: hypothetical protein PMK43_002091 [Vibrio cholerae]|nr:hypothetical protein [Vibrio cholerae]HDI3344832.1 hypothetical protein [Vibrio cholerae]